ncbi:DUF1961 family protein [Persicobacter psychrovividus]|uniref:DUF1961 family protein n=1 Tax=Persicobacter psychrovividus TaxID=387638 RepID=A0ABM7VJ49_9BACT|nr:hypothetical protein PEPS_30950 [Persicobacter psychrovividus]
MIKSALGIAAFLLLVSCSPKVPNYPEQLMNMVNWEEPIYQANFANRLELKNWELEGGKSMEIKNKALCLESESRPDPSSLSGNHMVAWLKPEMPADFFLTYRFRPENKQEGLAILFFNARGVNGSSIFDKQLKKRAGYFPDYHSGDLNNYHISYWSGKRQGANLRKNHGFHLVAQGNDPISTDSTDRFHRIGLLKKGKNISLFVDGVETLQYEDDGAVGGRAITQPGWIGLRQMDHTHFAEYKDLAVYPLK